MPDKSTKRRVQGKVGQAIMVDTPHGDVYVETKSRNVYVTYDATPGKIHVVQGAPSARHVATFAE